MAEKSLFRYALVKSSLPEAKGVLMGRFLHNDPTCGLDEFAGDMAENRPNLDKASCRMMIGVLAACAADRMKANPGRIDLGDFSLEPAIAKSMPALDSPLGDENKIYLAARLSSDMRNCLADVTPTRISTEGRTWPLSAVETSLGPRKSQLHIHTLCNDIFVSKP